MLENLPVSDLVEIGTKLEARGWSPVLENLGYNHNHGHYQVQDLEQVLLADWLCGPDASDQFKFQRFCELGWRALCAADPSYSEQVTQEDDWNEACGVFGWRFRQDGSYIPSWD